MRWREMHAQKKINKYQLYKYVDSQSFLFFFFQLIFSIQLSSNCKLHEEKRILATRLGDTQDSGIYYANIENSRLNDT